MADTLVGDVEITSDGHGCGDVEPVVMPFEVVFEVLGQRDAVILRGQPVAFGGHVRQHLVLAGYEGAAAVRGQVVEQLALAAAHPLRAAEAFEVRTADVGQDAVVGLGDRGQQGDFAASAGSHLDHAEPCVAGHGEQRERHADVVVEVTARGVDLEAFGQHAAHQLLGRGLAVAARYGEYRDRQPAAVFACQLLQCPERVADQHHTVVGDGCRVVHDGIGRAFFQRLRREAVAVERRAAQGEEDGISPDVARVGGDVRVFPENIV